MPLTSLESTSSRRVATFPLQNGKPREAAPRELCGLLVT